MLMGMTTESETKSRIGAFRQLTLVLGMQRMYAALEGILWQTKHLPFDVMRNVM